MSIKNFNRSSWIILIGIIGLIFISLTSNRGFYTYFIQQYQRTQQDETLRSELEEIDRIQQKDAHQAFQYAQEVLERHRGSRDQEARAELFYWLGFLNYAIEKDGNRNLISLTFARKAISIGKSLGDTYLQAKNLKLLGAVYLSHQKYDSTRFFIKKSLNLCNQLDKSDPTIKHLIGENYKGLGVAVLNQAVFKPKKDSLSLNDSLKKSIVHLSYARDLFQQVGTKGLEDEIISLRNIAMAYLNLKSSKNAIFYGEEALHRARQLGDIYVMKQSYQKLGEIYQDIHYYSGTEQDLRKGSAYLREALNIASSDSSEIYKSLGNLYHLGEYFAKTEKKKNLYLDSSKYFYMHGIEVAEREGNATSLKDILNDYSYLCSQKGNCQKVLDKANAAYFNLIKENQALSFAEEHDFRNFKLKQEELQYQQERTISLLIYSFIFAMAVTIFFLFFQRMRLRAMKQQLEARMEALQAQMNPHFVSNCLHSIETRSNTNRNKEASTYLIHFSLDHSRQKVISLSEEIESLEHFLKIEKLRMGDKLNHKFVIDQSINPDQIMIPPLLLQPIVENAIWHGLQPKEEGGNITIEFLKENETTLYCAITDNGVGMNYHKSKMEGHQSHSGQIINERIEMIDKQQGASIKIIDLESEKGKISGTKVELFINVINP